MFDLCYREDLNIVLSCSASFYLSSA